MTRRRIVEETLIPGAKVTDVARRNGVAANLLHCWHLADVEGLLCARSGLSLPIDARPFD
jgi:transposase-like protein